MTGLAQKLALHPHEEATVNILTKPFSFTVHAQLEHLPSHKKFIEVYDRAQKALLDADKRIYDRLAGRVSCVRPARILVFLLCLATSFLVAAVTTMLLRPCPRK